MTALAWKIAFRLLVYGPIRRSRLSLCANKLPQAMSLVVATLNAWSIEVVARAAAQVQLR